MSAVVPEFGVKTDLQGTQALTPIRPVISPHGGFSNHGLTFVPLNGYEFLSR
jgi:hypothetical protein